MDPGLPRREVERRRKELDRELLVFPSRARRLVLRNQMALSLHTHMQKKVIW